MRQNFLALICIAITLPALAACSGTAPDTAVAPAKNSPATAPEALKVPAEIVRASAAETPTELRAGASAEAAVRLAIADGFHINANPATYSYLIPTQLEVAPEEGVRAGEPIYPAPLTKKFAFDPQPLAVYEGEVTIKLPLSADTAARRGDRVLRAKIRVQPCNDQACLAPRTVETSLPVTIN